MLVRIRTWPLFIAPNLLPMVVRICAVVSLLCFFSAPTAYAVDPVPPPGQPDQTAAPADPNAPPPDEEAQTDNEACDSTLFRGVGWIICPVSNFLASMMDNVYEILTDFLVVRNATTSLDTPLYRMWVIMRDIANIAFVIAFLVVIYSQITQVGMSSYAIKKSLPRIVIAAILVNVSFWVCALAVDISNLLGYTIYDFMMAIHNSFVPDTGQYEAVTWEALVALLLAGGTAGVAGIALSGGFAAATYMLLPALVGVALAILVAVVILAARQALITVLVIVSPLAFVAYILPNTEKYFDKWKDTFMTMLLLFPIFSLIFAGAQVAGLIIIQNANGSAVTLLFGMIVQVAPIVITPMLIKFSGSLLGRIAGIVNNPNRGLIDRTRNWAQSQANMSASRVRSGRGRGPMGGLVRHLDRQKRMREAETKDNDTMTDSKFSTYRYERTLKKRRLMERQMKIRNAADAASAAESEIDLAYKNAEAGVATHGVSQKMVARIHHTHEQAAITGIAKSMAERKQTSVRAEMLKAQDAAGEALRRQAAGIMGEDGMRSVEANARRENSKMLANDVDNIESTLDNKLATNTKWLLTQLVQNPKITLAERVAYSNLLSKAGGPGITALKQAVSDYDSKFADKYDDSLQDYKDFMRSNSAFMGAGKDLEFWATNSKDEATGAARSFDSLTRDAGTWSNISAENITTLNVASQFRMLNVLATGNAKQKALYQRHLKAFMANEGQLYNKLKPSVQDAIAKNSWQQLDPNKLADYIDPAKDLS